MKNVKAGFTLIELLIVIAIIGILAAVLVPNLLNARKAANDSATQTMLRNAVTSAESWSSANGGQRIKETACSLITGIATAAGQSTEQCTIIQDANSTYGVAKSSSGTVFTWNGKTMANVGSVTTFADGATVRTSTATGGAGVIGGNPGSATYTP